MVNAMLLCSALPDLLFLAARTAYAPLHWKLFPLQCFAMAEGRKGMEEMEGDSTSHGETRASVPERASQSERPMKRLWTRKISVTSHDPKHLYSHTNRGRALEAIGRKLKRMNMAVAKVR